MKKAAVIGNPIGHSRSPLIHNYWLKKYNIEGSYEPIMANDESDFKNVVDRLIEENYSGFNVTVPFKEIAHKIADERINTYEYHASLKAANTISIQNKKLIAYNTDYHGFRSGFDYVQSIKALGDPQHDISLVDQINKGTIKNIVILGAGGSARSTAFGLLYSSNLVNKDNASLTILNRDEKRAKDLRSDLYFTTPSYSKKAGVNLNHGLLNDLNQILNNCDLLINCTSMGMEGGPESLEISFKNVKNTTIIYDLVYTPLETPLIKRAKEAGLLTINGLRMLISQAAPAFMIFYGDKTDRYARDPLSDHYALNKSKDNVFTMDKDTKLFKTLEKDIGKLND